MALFIARLVPGTDAWRSRLQGWCTASLANAQRVGVDLPTSEATFARVWRLWRAGKDEAGLLSEAQGVHREAIAAVILFREAAEKEQISADLVRRLSDYLQRAQREPGLRFKA